MSATMRQRMKHQPSGFNGRLALDASDEMRGPSGFERMHSAAIRKGITMSKSTKPAKQAAAKTTYDPNTTINLNSLVVKVDDSVPFEVWIVGDTPLITNAWSHKAKKQMLEKQIGVAKSGKAIRVPQDDFREALYQIEPGVYGFPVTGIKNSWLSAAHKDKNIPRTTAMAGIYLNGQMTRLVPGEDGAICDMPLVRLVGSDPEMREDMVLIGSGFKKVANLAYRPQFSVWAIKVTGKLNPHLITPDKLVRLVNDGGLSVGIGEWRPEKKGPFGSYHLATVAEAKAWTDFDSGRGPLPIPPHYILPVAAE